MNEQEDTGQLQAAGSAPGPPPQDKCKIDGAIPNDCPDTKQQEVRRMQVRSSQVDNDELVRLVRDEALALPDLNIAISGIAGRFPKSDSTNEFEENLREGRDMINDNDDSRFTCGLWNLPPRAGRLRDLSKFDHEFFGYSLDHANYIDFQLRILYEVVYESILDAGLNPANLRGTKTGVFFGLHCNEFENAMADDPAFKSNGYYAQFAIKVAQYFDFRGLTLTFDAACASGFLGLHNAVESLRAGIVEQAVVCSSNIPVHPTGSFIFYQMQMLSPTGYSRFLDSRADGYVKSEACVSVLLQRKHLAKRNYASLMATMTSVDGYKPEGITFPSYKSQEELIRATKRAAGISTNHVEYLEAHGTGTPAGDPQEASAISNVYFPPTTRDTPTDDDHEDGQLPLEIPEQRTIGPLLVGSVKTSMGHSEAASGLCALVKVALMLENELIYKNLHFDQPNTNIESLMDGRLKFVDKLQPLRSKIIPLSCYGFGGANVHAICRANERETIVEAGGMGRLSTGGIPRLVVMFGRGEQQLNGFFDQLMRADSHNTQFCLTDDFLSLLDSTSSSKIDRLMNHRGYLLVEPSDGVSAPRELARSVRRCELEAARQDERPEDPGRRVHLQECAPRPVHLVLPGLGCQWTGMARGLANFELFWATIERLDVALEPYREHVDLLELFQSSDDAETQLETSLCRAFVGIVAYEIALVNLVRDHLKTNSLGAIVGHSLGEIACAYAAKLFDERETIMVAYQLGRTLDKHRHLIAGKMVALMGLPWQELESLLDEHHRVVAAAGSSEIDTTRVSCVNGPDSVTVSGRREHVDRLLAWLIQDKPQVGNQLIVHEVSGGIALHNELIMRGSGIEQELRAALERVLLPLTDYDRTRTSWVSSFKVGQTTEADERVVKQANVDYFVEMLCRRVDFRQALEQLESNSIVYELGPVNLFESQIIQMHDQSGRPRFTYVRTMQKWTEPEKQPTRLLSSFGELYQAGATFDLANFYALQSGCEPTFPVRRQTPSLSSLIKWDHSASLFVPRYPVQFSKSSAKCEMPIDLVDRDKYLAGHCIEGRVLHPATGYLFLIWRIFSFTKRKIYDACFHDIESELVPVEFRGVKLMRAVLLSQTRPAQMYVHFEEATGRFEVKEGGSVVCEGHAFTPEEEPNGLLYESVRTEVKAKQLELTLSRDDVYKQFRVSGYDYGETFQCIESASRDGQVCRVKFNGYFVCLTDSILQSIFLAIAEFAPAGALFLPTRFDYVRFQPATILAKLRAAKMTFDLGDGSLNTKAKREMMNKIMQRESDAGKREAGGPGDESAAHTAGADPAADAEDSVGVSVEKPECIFETYCDPRMGVIITDGIEMRGIRASPAPRRGDSNEVQLESYQFVPDEEMPIEDERLTRFNARTRPYLEVCNSMSLELLTRLCGRSSTKELNGLVPSSPIPTRLEIESYINEHLDSVYGRVQATAAGELQDEKRQAGDEEEAEKYDIKRNGERTLMSILDQLLALSGAHNLELERIQQCVAENRAHLMKDLLSSSYTSERLIRPLVETVIENVCQKKAKLRMIEVNVDDAILQASFMRLITQIEPGLQLDYALGHPDPSRLHGSALGSPQAKTHTLKTIMTFFTDNQLKNLDLVVYKDASCYAPASTSAISQELSEEHSSKAQLGALLQSLNQSVRSGGYFMLMLRKQLTLAERILVALSEPEAMGSTRDDLAAALSSQSSAHLSRLADKIEAYNERLSQRCDSFLEQARELSRKCRLVAQKGDQTGCLVLLFRRLDSSEASQSADETTGDPKSAKKLEASKGRDEPLLLRVRHDDFTWLDELKRNFCQGESSEFSSSSASESGASQATSEQSSSTSASSNKSIEPRRVWLIAVHTRQTPVSGLVGMMQALRKELGSGYLRCFYDAHTYRDFSEDSGGELSLEQITQSAAFKEALERDQIWNCLDERTGRLGSYRHFSINESLSYADCLCAKQAALKESVEADEAQSSGELVRGAYVNSVTRGDLSSFAWHEAPFKYLHEQEDGDDTLVRVAYSALNFRDVMLATGRLPLDTLPMRLAMADCLLGLEFSGRELRTGKRVMGMVYGRGIATLVQCPRKNSIKLEIPHWLSLADAATIPVVYATAVMALICRGRAKRGESVLIHAGSGGVGQAAIRLSLHLGLEVFTTVGSREKRDFLLAEFAGQLKGEQIFSSRSCDFEQQVLLATRGRGVDLVLNSLAEDKLQASLNCLADGGRFLEIGKYDLTVDTQLELLKLERNKSFHGILLDKLFDVDDMTGVFERQLLVVLETLRRGLAEGFVRPIKHETFKHNQVEEAFRYMATGKHIGKVLIEIDGQLEAERQPLRDGRLAVKCVPRFQLSRASSYIVTGGLGGFGLELCKWLVAHGARHLVLTSRQGLRTGYQRATLGRLETNEGARLKIVTEREADASQAEGARRLCAIARELSPAKRLGGVFHLAMVLKDTLLENMSHEDFAQVCRPKLAACQALDAATRRLAREQDHQLDYFVAFSSITSGKGNAGQANYAYANSALERVCESRRRDALHGLAIQWGAIGDVGVAFENLGGNDVVIGGTRPQRVVSCLATLERLLCSPFAVCLSVVPVSRSAEGLGGRGDLVGAIMHVLGIKDTSKVSEQATLGELGLDSLMAVEIRQYIEREYDMTLNIQEIRALTIERIREIGENEKPAGSKLALRDEAKKKEAASYGEQKQQAQKVVAEAPSGGPGVTFDLPVDGAPAAATNSPQAQLDKDKVSSFVPALELPETDFCRLNYKTELERKTRRVADSRPIFFLPPIHGGFDQLEPVCAHIERPCVGLNWTYKFGRAHSVEEAVRICLELLGSADWARDFQLGESASAGQLEANMKGKLGLVGETPARVVDLVGYSFGATIAFELMRALHLQPDARLLPGRLILLDGSPKQLELGSQLLAGLASGAEKTFELGEKIDELLIVYLAANVRAHDEQTKLDFAAVQQELRRRRAPESKVKFASKKLVALLSRAERLRNRASNRQKSPRSGAIGAAVATSEPKTQRRSRAQRAQAVARAMETFLRRHELISTYQARQRLPVGCTLIRAEALYLRAADERASLAYNEDLDLGSVVDGPVELHIMAGNHETFLSENSAQIGAIITRACQSAAAAAAPASGRAMRALMQNNIAQTQMELLDESQTANELLFPQSANGAELGA